MVGEGSCGPARSFPDSRWGPERVSRRPRRRRWIPRLVSGAARRMSPRPDGASGGVSEHRREVVDRLVGLRLEVGRGHAVACRGAEVFDRGVDCVDLDAGEPRRSASSSSSARAGQGIDDAAAARELLVAGGLLLVLQRQRLDGRSQPAASRTSLTRSSTVGAVARPTITPTTRPTTTAAPTERRRRRRRRPGGMYMAMDQLFPTMATACGSPSAATTRSGSPAGSSASRAPDTTHTPGETWAGPRIGTAASRHPQPSHELRVGLAVSTTSTSPWTSAPGRRSVDDDHVDLSVRASRTDGLDARRRVWCDEASISGRVLATRPAWHRGEADRSVATAACDDRRRSRAEIERHGCGTGVDHSCSTSAPSLSKSAGVGSSIVISAPRTMDNVADRQDPLRRRVARCTRAGRCAT
jgi:hypothetical protein